MIAYMRCIRLDVCDLCVYVWMYVLLCEFVHVCLYVWKLVGNATTSKNTLRVGLCARVCERVSVCMCVWVCAAVCFCVVCVCACMGVCMCVGVCLRGYAYGGIS